jgi:HAD superfamily hydrolase (TIGR01509 family)
MRTLQGCQKLLPEMVKLVHDLNTQGYTLGIATNMGNETVTKLKQQYADFFANFSIITTPDTIGSSGTFFKKPDIQFFILFQKNHNLESKKIIFIDDCTKNVHAAEQAGMQGIQFKNPQQLHIALQDFKLRGI